VHVLKEGRTELITGSIMFHISDTVTGSISDIFAETIADIITRRIPFTLTGSSTGKERS
jgi:hypothetical protein